MKKNKRLFVLVGVLLCALTALGLSSRTQEVINAPWVFQQGFSTTTGPLTSKSGDTVPTSGSAGYGLGCEFLLRNASLGQAIKWINVGSESSCLFVPNGQVVAYGFSVGGGPQTSAGGDTTEVITLSGQIISTDISFVEHYASDDTDNIVAQIAANDKITITGSADPLTAHSYQYAALRADCVSQWDIVAAGTHTTAGGAVAEAITVTGALVGDIAFVTYSATNDTDTIVKSVVTANTLTVTMSADPSTVHGLHYIILRPRGSFKPSHYVAYAGVHTTAGGAAAEAITVTGALATDVAIVKYNTTNDTDTILKAVVTANTLTVTMSADPSTAHKLAYMLLRAYN